MHIIKGFTNAAFTHLYRPPPTYIALYRLLTVIETAFQAVSIHVKNLMVSSHPMGCTLKCPPILSPVFSERSRKLSSLAYAFFIIT
jgi:hypothetical protein